VLAVEQLGQREIVAGVRSRAGVHRDAEAGVARLRAVDGDDEGIMAAGLVVGVGVGVADEHLVLDEDRSEVAGADAEEGVARPLLLLLLVSDRAVLRALRLPEGQVGREQVVLPGVRAVVEAEEGIVVTFVEPVGAALLFVGQSLRKVGHRGDLLVDDRAVSDARTDHRVAAVGQDTDQPVQPRAVDNPRRALSRFAH
jgi:hypothetical protein